MVSLTVHERLTPVSIESPLNPDKTLPPDEREVKLRSNMRYARECMMDSIMRGEAPFASHLLYTQVLDDDNMAQRIAGLALGHAWRLKAELIVFYIDWGMSAGMLDAKALAEANNIPCEERRLYQ